METKNISLSKVKEWYNSNCSTLKEAALQLFSKEELEFSFKDIKDMSDVLIQFPPIKIQGINEAAKYLNENQKALVILSMIREVLNKGYNMKAFEGNIYYPYNPLITLNSTLYSDKLESGEMKEVAKILIEGKKYILLGGCVSNGGPSGLLSFLSSTSVSLAVARVGFLGCATEEIAKHMSLYFGKEIFDAKYKGYFDYKWIKD